MPKDWGEGWENVFFNVTCENQLRADERIKIMKDLPFKHKGIMTAPLLGEISIKEYLSEGQIEQVICGGENYAGARLCKYEWVKKLRDDCVATNVTFAFIGTGNKFEKDGRLISLNNNREQMKLAYSYGLSYQGKSIKFKLTDRLGLPIDEESYAPQFKCKCLDCGSRPVCNGCENCGRCDGEFLTAEEI